MCGIAGIFSTTGNDSLQINIDRMVTAIQHRGPDDKGSWISDNLAFGHARLAIQDLSPNGKQPMRSRNERYVIAFNGEIYNFISIRDSLKKLGHQFIGGSDTEVMLAAFEEWGLNQALEKFEGMFAFSLWDKLEKTLHLCRDRLGEKPLFYAWTDHGLVWASELKALTSLPFWKGDINTDSVISYLKYGYVPAPNSIYQNCYKLVPGSILAITDELLSNPHKFSPVCSAQKNIISPEYYWKFSDVILQTKSSNPANYEDSIEELDQLLAKVIKDQMISDVPYGAFLSGGIDSSLVSSIMQSLSSNPINTFTIGFTEKDFNEAVFAKEISTHLGTNHHELYISSQDCLDLVPRISSIMDEPFADSSVLPAYFVSSMAKQHVTVSLSGDAGDELFCGYNRYTKPEEIWSKVKHIPPSFRILIANILGLFPPAMIDKVYRLLSAFIFSKNKNTRIGLKVQKLSQLLKINDIDEVYEMLLCYCHDIENIMSINVSSSKKLTTITAQSLNLSMDFVNRAMAIDTLTYLPDDNLTKVDRTSMASSLETRQPLLNHKVVEKAWQLPLEMKLHHGTTKRILRDILYKRVPRKLIERPKMGFSVPIASWLKGPLKDWAQSLLLDSQNMQHGYFDQTSLNKTLSDHLEGRKDNSACLWNILMFQAWYNT